MLFYLQMYNKKKLKVSNIYCEVLMGINMWKNTSKKYFLLALLDAFTLLILTTGHSARYYYYAHFKDSLNFQRPKFRRNMWWFYKEQSP